MATLNFDAIHYGPNPLAGGPVLVASLKIDSAAEIEALAKGAEALRRTWPEWFEGRWPLEGKPSALAIAGTAVHWALCALNEVRGHLKDAGARGEADGGVILWLAFHQPAVSRFALELAFRVMGAAASPQFSMKTLEADLRTLWDACRRHHPDYQARILMQAADARGIPYLPFIEGTKYWQYGWGARSRVFHESASNADGFLAGLLQRSKLLSKSVFASLGVPTPPHAVVGKAEDLPRAAQDIGWPCVLKPVDGSGGKGVTAGIRNAETMQQAFVAAQRGNAQAPVIVEAFVAGDDHRLMVIDGRLVAAIRREPSSVTGDGTSTIRELVAGLNAVRSSNMVKSRYLRPIAVDDILMRHIATQGADLDTVLPAGQRMRIRSNSNLSTGGICIDVTSQVHPQVRQFAEAISQAFGLGSAGLDYMTTDISEAPSVSGGRFIEANLMPGLDATIAAGWDAVDIGAAALGGKPGRIPSRLFIVAQAQQEAVLASLRAAVLDPTAAWACGSSSRAGDLAMEGAAGEPWAAVRRVLRLPRVERIDIVLALEDLLRHGMPLDRVDRTVLCGVEVSSSWRETIERHSGEVRQIAAWTADWPG